MILLLHISDIHFKTTKNRVATRAAKIAAIVNQFLEPIEACVILVSGDIANAGLPEEYELAKKFLVELETAIAENPNVAEVKILVAPGNHDCDFTKGDGTRALLLKQIASEPDTRHPEAVIASCTSTQNAFFEFASKIEKRTPCTTEERLYRSVNLVIGKTPILVCIYNTAWISALKEKQGELSFPVLPELESQANDLVISLFHHPTAWLGADNAAKFRARVETTSDIILTGHEHRPGSFEKVSDTGGASLYFEGGALQPHNEVATSHFNVICVDIEKSQRKRMTYGWNSGSYKREGSSDWLPFVRGSQRGPGFRFTTKFKEHLDEPGAQFTHPMKATLLLQDVFVYPRLREIKLLRGKNAILSGRRIIELTATQKRILILGDDQSGKTAFARVLCRELYEHGLVHLLLSGRDLISSDSDIIYGKIRDACASQYAIEPDVILELSPSKRALVIDDLDKCPLTRDARRAVHAALDRFAGVTVMFSGDLLRFDELSEEGGENPLLLVPRYELLPFGHELRNELITQWHNIDRERGSEEELVSRVRKTEAIVTTVIGNQIVPAYPIFLLILIQQEEAFSRSETASSSGGSYGYLYEYLITRSLGQARASDDPDLDTSYQYLSELAYQLFDKSQKSLSHEELGQFHQRYCDEYSIDLNSERTRDLFIRAGLLKVEAKRYSFKYPYCYYYFVARALQRNKIRFEARVASLIDAVYREENASIIIFLAHLESEERVIALMLEKARGIYKDADPCNLEHQVRFVEAMGVAPRSLLLPDSAPRENRHRLLIEKDKREIAVHDSEREEEQREEEQRELNASLQLNVALKTVAILGQILRNFSGSLKGERKLEIARECYLLGMRTLTTFLGLIETHKDRLATDLREILSRQSLYEPQIKERIDGAIYWLAEVLAFGLVQRTADAVGLYKLTRTYNDIVATDSLLLSP